jgi:hypothetical protein
MSVPVSACLRSVETTTTGRGTAAGGHIAEHSLNGSEPQFIDVKENKLVHQTCE